MKKLVLLAGVVVAAFGAKKLLGGKGSDEAAQPQGSAE